MKKNEICARVIVTDFGCFDVSDKTILAYTGEKDLKPLSRRSKAYKKRQAAIDDLVKDVEAMSRFFWVTNGQMPRL